ncbi:MAG: type II toxin-antitoxin system HicA family toxin [Acidobacteriota bacterium]
MTNRREIQLMKRRDFEQHLEHHRCVFEREGARHTVFRNAGTGKRSTVPRHTELKKGLVVRICRDLDIPSSFKGD